jgi:hypothetical protein
VIEQQRRDDVEQLAAVVGLDDEVTVVAQDQRDQPPEMVIVLGEQDAERAMDERRRRRAVIGIEVGKCGFGHVESTSLPATWCIVRAVEDRAANAGQTAARDRSSAASARSGCLSGTTRGTDHWALVS